MLNLKHFLYKNIVDKYVFSKKFKDIGITFEQYYSYIHEGLKNNITTFATSTLFGVNIKRVGNYSFVQNVEEVLVDEVYKFVSKRPNPIILDCGANVGLSIIYFKRLYPAAIIVGFEPDINMFNACLYNLKSFGYNDVELINAAVWDDNGEISFHSDNSLGGKVVDDNDSGMTSKVKAIRLKDYLINKVDFLKIDIEGAELDVLRDCQTNLANVETLFVEYHSSVTKPQQLSELLDIITNSGFRYYIKHAWDYMKHPFVDHKAIKHIVNDLQLNIFCYRK